MDCIRAVMVMASLTLLLSICGAIIETKREWRQWKKQQKLQKKNKKMEKKSKKFANQPDPSDISNLLGGKGCAGNFDMSSLFGSMFMPETDVDKLVTESLEEMKVSRLSANKRRNRYVVSNRMSKPISVTSAFPNSRAIQDNTCCETRMNITAPGMVMVDGKMMSVVHMNHSYQFVQEGECVNPGSRCRDIGVCSQVYKYEFMLLYDPSLVGKVNPPVTFGRVPIKSHCECMNIGRII